MKRYHPKHQLNKVKSWIYDQIDLKNRHHTFSVVITTAMLILLGFFFLFFLCIPLIWVIQKSFLGA